jgi:hypothetical protein
MNDYTWPSSYFAYLLFAICFFGAIFFSLRSWKDGYWGKHAEDVKFQVFEDSDMAQPLSPASRQEVNHGPR